MTNVLSTSPLITSIYLCEFFLLLRSIIFKYPLHTAIGFLIYSLLHKPDGQLTADHINQPTAAKNYYSPLTGRKVNSESDTKLPVLAVMIEISPEARPKRGGQGRDAIVKGGQFGRRSSQASISVTPRVISSRRAAWASRASRSCSSVRGT